MSLRFDGQRAYRHIEELAVKIGPRLSGTEGERRAAAYIYDQLESFGLAPFEQRFEMADEAAAAVSLEVLEPHPAAIRCHPHLGSPDTPPQGLTGELVFAEGAREPEVGPHIRGKIVVLNRIPGTAGSLRNLLQYQPLALIYIGSTLGREPNTFHWVLKEMYQPLAHVPAVFVTYEDALRLWNSGAKTARIVSRAERRQGSSGNVIAEIKGSLYPDEIVVVAGHMDSVPEDPGATDNAAGVATMLELARLYAGRGSRRTLRFAAWGSEEGSGAGSMAYALDLKKRDHEQRAASDYVEGYSKTDLEKHLLNVNLDVLGMTLGENFCYLLGPDELGSHFYALACELGIPLRVSTEEYGSDNLTFGWFGVPSISVVRGGPAEQYMHTVEDTIGLISTGQLERIGRLVDTWLARTAAEGYIWPFKREVPKAGLAGLEPHMRQVTRHLKEDIDLLK